MEGFVSRWKYVLATALLGAIGTLIASVGTDWFTREEASLSYSATESIPFPGTDKQFGIYHISFRNKGDKECNNVLLHMQVRSAILIERKLAIDPLLAHFDSLTSSGYWLHITQLLPNDIITISLLAQSKDSLPNLPNVSLRGDGVVGKIEKSEEAKLSSVVKDPFLLGIIAFVFMASTMPIFLRLFAQIRGKHATRGDQHRVLALLCSRFGFVDESTRLWNLDNETKYWSEADRFTANALASHDKSVIGRTSQLLIALIDFAEIADSSLGIVEYNVAMLLQNQGDKEGASKHLSKALMLNSSEIKPRLRIDPEMQSLSESLK